MTPQSQLALFLPTMRLFLSLVCFVFYTSIQAQTCTLTGRIVDTDSLIVESAQITELNTGVKVLSDGKGRFSIKVPCAGALIEISHPSYGKRNISPGYINGTFNMGDLVVKEVTLDTHEVVTESNTLPKIPKIEIGLIPNPMESVEGIVKTWLGVKSNNEMSANYNVRGGSFNENLIYVNGIEIYRPFLVRAGQQEGLSFINPDLVKNIYFSSGGFEAQYDDRLSSVLDIEYRKPNDLKATFSAGLLGARVHVENESKNHRFTWMMGARYQANSYLLNTLDTKGDYRPRFGDFQTVLSYDITDELEISWLNYYASNNYNVVPQTRETDFGTISEALRLTVFYDGQEINLFRTLAQGLTLKYQPNNRTTFKWINSWFYNDEQENFDILGSYRLGQVENDPDKENFGEVAFIKGVGGFLEHARNRLKSNIVNSKFLYQKKKKQLTSSNRKQSIFDAGIKFQYQQFNDELSEWNLVDSAGFSTPQQPEDQIVLNYVLKAQANLKSMLAGGFVQNRWKWQFVRDSINLSDSVFSSISSLEVTAGLRGNYLDINNQFNIGPRLSLTYVPSWFKKNKAQEIKRRNIILRLAGGVYHQPPLYRELRGFDGQLNTNLKAQQSIDAILGADWYFTLWNRTFKYTAEAYYKYLSNVIPYTIDNVRLRYYANNNAKGYATGVDMKVNGEFIKGIESWATVSYLRTQEDILDDSYINNYNSDGEKIIPGFTANDSIVRSETIEPGYIPRPTDQTLSFSIFFQDEMPKLEQFKVHLNLLFATGVPFGPPDNIKYNDTLRGPFYRRLDIGFSYELFHNKNKLRPGSIGTKIDKAFISFEVFNLLGVSNTISYNWIEDATGATYAVPNYLTGRRFNLKFLVKF